MTIDMKRETHKYYEDTLRGAIRAAARRGMMLDVGDALIAETEAAGENIAALVRTCMQHGYRPGDKARTLADARLSSAVLTSCLQFAIGQELRDTILIHLAVPAHQRLRACNARRKAERLSKDGANCLQR